LATENKSNEYKDTGVFTLNYKFLSKFLPPKPQTEETVRNGKERRKKKERKKEKKKEDGCCIIRLRKTGKKALRKDAPLV
jgi:hypothetical protein